MANPAIPREVVEESIRAVERLLREGKARPPDIRSPQSLRGVIVMASEALGIARTTLQDRLKRAKRLYGLEPDWSLYQPLVLPENTEEITVRERRRYSEENSHLRAQLQAAHDELNAQEDIRKVLFGLTSAPLSPPSWTLRPMKRGGKLLEVPVLWSTDRQWGEVVRAEEVQYHNAYDPKIAARRYRTFIESGIDLCLNHMVDPDYPGIVYLRGGDSISGDISEEFRETNALSPNPAVKDLAEKELWGINQLADAFGRVVVISVPGNHDRTKPKPPSKRYADLSWDDILSWHLEKIFAERKDERIAFFTPRSGEARFRIYGTWFMLVHGDRMGTGGGQGFIGPAAPIVRGIKKTRDFYARIKKPVDYVMVGHYHTSMEVPGGFSCSAAVGFNEYAMRLKAEPEPPQQRLLFVHPTRGITARWPIYLDDPKPLPPDAPAEWCAWES